MQWEEGDSSWDKINVSGDGPDTLIVVHRYEEPGPFTLSITIKTRSGASAKKAYLALRDKVLRALRARVWEPLKPQRVPLIKLGGRFPAAYEFECNLGMADIKRVFDDAEFGYWEALEKEPHGFHLEGWIPFRLAGRVGRQSKEQTLPTALPQASAVVRIVGKKPNYRIEVGRRQHELNPRSNL